MKLASFYAAGADRIGALLDGNRILDLAAVLPPERAPRSMLELIEAGPQALAAVQEALERATRADTRAATYALDEITWHPPVRRPSKICCLALNNSANTDRILSGPKHPAAFLKPSSALAGHGAAIECKPHYGRVHPEPELAVVIAKTARNVPAAEAYDYVFGYTIHNDITSPTMRGEDTFHYRAIHPKGGDAREIEYVDTYVSYTARYKCSDTFACMGPWVVTKDEIPEPHNLTVSCHHKGELITEDNTANLFYKTPEVLAFLSGYLTLLAGDIISLGTALKKSAQGGAVQNVDLNKLGGPVSVTIERIGTLSNPVVHLPG